MYVYVYYDVYSYDFEYGLYSQKINVNFFYPFNVMICKLR